MDLPDPGIEPVSLALQADSLPTELSGKPLKAKVPVNCVMREVRCGGEAYCVTKLACMLIRALLLSQWGQRTERTSSGWKIHIRTGKELVLQKRTPGEGISMVWAWRRSRHRSCGVGSGGMDDGMRRGHRRAGGREEGRRAGAKCRGWRG